uniref:site-specific DNA-methyltransferase (adenine-specific) n=1 Tax=Chlorobium chlorochromatii (strain CaD3) TaxID=340177 RepID=Q3AR06_CHLCH
MPITKKEIRDNALRFALEWRDASRERAEAQTFWNEFFQIFGVSRRRVASFEEPVKKLGEKRGSIDLFWKGTLVVEHKSRGGNLDKAYNQALDYFPGLKEEELPKYVLVSDFDRFCLYDLNENTQCSFLLNELPEHIDLFGFISGHQIKVYKDEDPVNIQVAEKMGELHDALLDSGYDGHDLEVFLVRLVYCLFADDTGIFNAKGDFEDYLRNKTKENGSDTGSILANMFQVLDTPYEKRQKTLDEDLVNFPYVNGDLFREPLRIAHFNGAMRELLLECCLFDWSKVSPAIFGSLFQSVMDRKRRRNLGAHYTSEKNILKVICGLFLDDLRREFEAIKNDARKVTAFHNKIAAMRFFDPACGCGNFLVITYREIRQLEIEVLQQYFMLTSKMYKAGVTQLETDIETISKIDVNQFYGIEIEEFPARIAQVALWLTDHQMNMRLSQAFGQTYVRLPLQHAPNIICDNALRKDWETVIPSKEHLYILGNPPFIGKQNRNAGQMADMDVICQPLKAKGLPNYGVLDYVALWYIKAALFIENSNVKVTFVSTNSITQGEQVAALWEFLLRKGVKIFFAHRTFKWTNEARGNAQVFCVIIGFTWNNTTQKKRLFDYETPQSESHEIEAKNINPYLIDAIDIVVSSRNKPLCNVPEMLYGSKPVDDGNLFFDDDEKVELLKKEPKAEQFIRRVISAHEFINGKNRWCLWLKDIAPNEWRNLPELVKLVEAVRGFRLKSKKAATVKLAEVPYLFGEIRQPETNYIVIPLHSSEHRKFIPTGYFSKDNILHNSCSAVPNATLYHFGILTSTMHMVWMRTVCGRIKSDYRYSNNLVYNNFLFPHDISNKQKAKVEEKAQAVLNARELFPNSTLADLYDPLTMPKALLTAHRELDAAVDACYRKTPFQNELERLEFLFQLYSSYTQPLVPAMDAKPKRKRMGKG